MRIIKEVFSEKETYEYARSLAMECKGGEVFSLDGDLGVGKTLFSKGFAKGLGIEEIISSPTFAIVMSYQGKLTFNHFDIYRINYEDELDDIGFYDYINDNKSVNLIEWGGLFINYLPKDITRIIIKKDLQKGLNYRLIIIEKN